MMNESEQISADELRSIALRALNAPGFLADEGVNSCQEQRGVESHPLYAQYIAAIEQAMFGKGERHGGAKTDFLEQPWMHYAKMHGRGFLTGQAAKKLEEAASTRTGEAFAQEIRGAIVYLGMALIWEEMQGGGKE